MPTPIPYPKPAWGLLTLILFLHGLAFGLMAAWS